MKAKVTFLKFCTETVVLVSQCDVHQISRCSNVGFGPLQCSKHSKLDNFNFLRMQYSLFLPTENQVGMRLCCQNLCCYNELVWEYHDVTSHLSFLHLFYLTIPFLMITVASYGIVEGQFISTVQINLSLQCPPNIHCLFFTVHSLANYCGLCQYS